MKNLEERIIKKVYRYETKKVFQYIIIGICIVTIFLVSAIFLIQVIVSALYEEETLDVLQIFHEDISIVRDYWMDVLTLFYYEIPKWPAVFLIIILICLLALLLIFIKKFATIRHKLKSLLTYWKK